MPAMCDHAADGSEKGDTTIDDGIVQDRSGAGFCHSGDTSRARDAESMCMYTIGTDAFVNGASVSRERDCKTAIGPRQE
ncbi:unnamed protein product [Trichogramma brassicae]|uniref:Uncharacterized protein n=1 Tax=Trichogramma brassicae TaxID=86971 RepID=A0A6H5IH78_9HYME|nr:unnamed protein product [Trichogramma brassicae]